MSEQLEEYERDVSAKVYELTRGWNPAMNVAPIYDLVRQAKKYGLEVVRPPSPTPPEL